LKNIYFVSKYLGSVLMFIFTRAVHDFPSLTGVNRQWKTGSLKKRKLVRDEKVSPFGGWTLKDIDASYTRVN